MVENIVNEKILVTGGTGFLGNYVVKKLVAKNLAPTILTRNLQSQIFGKEFGQISLVRVDLLDFAAVRKVIEEIRPDRIIHLAGYTFQTDEQPDILEKFNYEATVNLLDIAKQTAVKKILMTGTADEYGFQNSPQVETMPAMPVSEYAISKNRAVEYALQSHRENDLPIVIMRPFTIYGIGQPAKMFVSQAVGCAVTGTAFEMSKGEQKRDLLFVTDFVNAIIELLMAQDTEGEIYNVGSGSSIALKDLAKKIWSIAGADENLLKIGARLTGANELHDTQADISKISRIIDWRPTVSLDEGLKLIVEKAAAERR